MFRTVWFVLLSCAFGSIGCQIEGMRVHGEEDSAVELDSGSPHAGHDAGHMEGHDAGGSWSGNEPGSGCNCDADCAGGGAHPAVCVFGICMQRASADCSAGGSQAECPAGSRCWGLTDVEGSFCWPDCDAHACDGTCDADGSCVPDETTSCNPACGGVCGSASAGPCAPDNPGGVCEADDEACIDGACVAVCTSTSPSGYCPPGSTCTGGSCVSASGCPTWMCAGSTCDDMILLPGSTDPTSAGARSAGYYRAHESRYSYLRQDYVMVLQHAACETAVHFPGTPPLGVGDLSQADGSTPGTDTGNLRHPDGTHTGTDMDLAYYQTDGANNLQIICGDGSDDNGNGYPGTYNDGYYCTSSTNIVDVPRQAYFFAQMANHPNARVFGVDRTLAAAIEAELDRLHGAGEITAAEHDGVVLGYDPPGTRASWVFHHHHAHLSYYH